MGISIHIPPGAKHIRRNDHKPDINMMAKTNAEIFYKGTFHNSPRVLKFMIRTSKSTKGHYSSLKGSLVIPPRKRLHNENVEVFMK